MFIISGGKHENMSDENEEFYYIKFMTWTQSCSSEDYFEDAC